MQVKPILWESAKKQSWGLSSALREMGLGPPEPAWRMGWATPLSEKACLTALFTASSSDRKCPHSQPRLSRNSMS